MPDGSRHRTSPRSDSEIRSVGRSRIDGASAGPWSKRAQVAELQAAVDQDGALLELAEGDGEIERERRLADPPFGAKTDMTRGRRGRRPARLELLAELSRSA